MLRYIKFLTLIIAIMLVGCSANSQTEEKTPTEKTLVEKTPYETEKPIVTEYTNTPGKNVVGGYLKFVAEPIHPSDPTKTYDVLQNYHTFKVTTKSDTIVTIKLGNVDGLGGNLGEYRITLLEDTRDLSTVGKKLTLFDWTTDHVQEDGTITLNLSEYVKNNGISSGVRKAILRFEIKKDATVEQYMLIESIVITSNVESEKELLEQISFTDANAAVLKQKDDKNEFPMGYWRSTGRRDLYAGIKQNNN